MVELIETHFVPVAVFNNQPGKDAETLRRFKEPAWNYQVVRYLDGDGEDVIPRKDRIWDLKGTATRMAEALEAADREVPKSLVALTD